MQAIHIESYHPSGKQSPASCKGSGALLCVSPRFDPFLRAGVYSTVTLLARLRGLSTSQPRSTAM